MKCGQNNETKEKWSDENYAEFCLEENLKQN